MNQTNEPISQPSSKRSGRVSNLGIGLIIITVISLAVAGFTVLNPHGTTITQQQMITSVQTTNAVQVVTVGSVVTVFTMGTNTVFGAPTNAQNCSEYGCPYSNSNPNCGTSSCAYPICDSNGCSFQLCGPNGCSVSPGYQDYTPQECGFNGCAYTTCQSIVQNNSVQCAGYLQNNNGCVEIVVPVTNYAIGVDETIATRYYTLQNLPSSVPPIGSWVTVNGQLNQGHNTASNGAACPGNYINVASITQ